MVSTTTVEVEPPRRGVAPTTWQIPTQWFPQSWLLALGNSLAAPTPPSPWAERRPAPWHRGRLRLGCGEAARVCSHRTRALCLRCLVNRARPVALARRLRWPCVHPAKTGSAFPPDRRKLAAGPLLRFEELPDVWVPILGEAKADPRAFDVGGSDAALVVAEFDDIDVRTDSKLGENIKEVHRGWATGPFEAPEVVPCAIELGERVPGIDLDDHAKLSVALEGPEKRFDLGNVVEHL